MAQATTSTATTAPKKVKSAPPFKLRSVNSGDQWLNIMVYGKHGAGKTTLAASAADVDPMNGIFMINAESGDLVMDSNSRIDTPENIQIADVSSFRQVVKMYEFLSSHCRLRDSPTEANIQKMKEYQAWMTGIEVEDIDEPIMYRTVIVDSLTEIEAYCMYELLGIQGEFDIAQIDDDMKTAEFAEYKKNNNKINLLVRAFRDLPMHVIILCAETYTQDEMKKFHYAPYLTGKLSTQIQGYFDIVGYLQVGAPDESGNNPRRLIVQPVGKWDAKNRRSSFKDPYFPDPTMGSILKSVGLLQQGK